MAHPRPFRLPGVLLLAGIDLFICVSLTAAPVPRILLVGDSWAYFQWNDRSVREALVQRGLESFEERGTRTALSGSRASQWARSEYLQILTDEITNFPSIDIVQITMGGNDLQAGASLAKISSDIETVVDHLLDLRGDIQVLLVGYDYLSGSDLPVSARQLNDFITRFEEKLLELAQRKERVEYLLNLGLMQAIFGFPPHFEAGEVPEPGPPPDYTPFQGGDPNHWSPPGVFRDFLHLNRDGYVALAVRAVDLFYDEWLVGSDFVSTGVEEAWVARYDGPGGTSDVATDMVVDTELNVYITGRSGEDATTVKYRHNGRQVWVTRHRSTGTGSAAERIATDGLGSVYVVGREDQDEPVFGRQNLLTVKYNSDGEEIWTRRFEQDDDFQYVLRNDLVVDGEGNAFVTVTGTCTNCSDDVSSYLLKYDKNGNELLGFYLNLSYSALALDTRGTLFAAGYSNAGGGYETRRFDPGGNERWSASVAGGVNPWDCACPGEIAVDREGSVYATSGVATVKYSAFGRVVWANRVGGVALAPDESGNVYVTGENGTKKYSVDGSELWVGEAGGVALALDRAGNVCVTGSSAEDILTASYSPDGRKLWSARYDTGGADEATALAVDFANNVYVAGTSSGDYVTIKYTPRKRSSFTRGDGNDDGVIDLSDPVYNLDVQFLGEHEPGCLAALDTNADGTMDISDPVYNLEYQFLGKPAPPPPYPGCAPESLPLDEALPCETQPANCP